MTTVFWIGLAIGAVLSLLALILANVFHDKIISFLDSRKVVSQQRSYAKALRFHQTVSNLRSGVTDKYLFMMRMTVGATLTGVSTMICCVALITIIALKPHQDPPPSILDTLSTPRELIICFLLFFAFLLLYLFVSVSSRFSNIFSAMNHFQEFDAAFKKRWPNATPPASN